MPRKAARNSRPNVVQRFFNHYGAMFRWTWPVSALPPPG